MLLEAMVQALQNFLTVELWLVIGLGMVIGLVFGLIPGVGGMLALAITLPFVFKMTPEQALPLMMSILAIQFMGGAITSILLNLPGTAGSIATLFDGFPMSQKGEAGRALGASLTASGLANILTAILALAMVFLILPLVMAFRSADMVFVMLLGITFIGVLGSGSMIKGLISGGMGLLISLIGYQATTGVPRLTFGSLYLYDGIAMVPFFLGVFAVPEMIALATRGGSISQSKVVIKGMQDVLRGVRDVFRHWKLVIRSEIIGFTIGSIPGLGASAATFIAYGEAKRTSKHPERYGTGIVEGVIAPESANNACESGALLTTLALGIPGSAVMAILMGAMLMLGITPGPEMLTKHLDLSLTLIWIIAVTGVIGAAICIPLASRLSRLAFVPADILVPLVVVILFVGSFSSNEVFGSIITFLIFGAVGLIMRRYGYNRPALALGFILGLLFERYFFIALKVAGPLFFMRPISLIIISVIIAFLIYRPVKKLIQQRRGVKKA
ncbi:tripartite tricarboxylate transporter permease [Chloroflexota bacterium]